MNTLRSKVGRFLTIVLALAALVACNQNAGPGGPAGDTGVDAPDGSEDPGCASQPCTIQWTDGPEFLRAVDHHSVSILENQGEPWLVVMGGARSENRQPQQTFPTVSGAPISPDGTLGAWQDLAEFNVPLLGHAQTRRMEGRVLLVGGIAESGQGGLTPARAVTSVSFEDGSPTANPGTALPDGRVHATAHILNEHLYVIGGLTGNSATASVLVSPLQTDGVNGEWADAPALPNPRTHHASVRYDGHIYIFGGSDLLSGSHTAILRSTLDEEGNITGWETIGQWTGARFSMAPFVFDDSVYLVGGVGGDTTQGRPVDTVTSIELTESGVGTITDSPHELPIGRSHGPSAPVQQSSDTVYLIGGRTSQTFNSTSRVILGQIGE